MPHPFDTPHRARPVARPVQQLAVAVLLAVPVMACAAAGGPRPSSRVAPRPPLNVIGEEELAAARPGTLLIDVVRARGAAFARDAGADVSVFVDGAYAGRLATLGEIRVAEVRTVRFLSGPEATFAYGSSHGGIVVDVTLRRPGR